MSPEIRDDRQMRALTGVSIEKLAILEESFATGFSGKKRTTLSEKTC